MSKKKNKPVAAVIPTAVKMPPRDTRADGITSTGAPSAVSASPAANGGIGAGLSAPGYTQPGETTAGVNTPAQAFIAAVRANDKAAIKTTYAALPQSGPAGIAAAYEIKDAFFNGSAADRAMFKANVAANKDVFPAKNYANFQTMMTMTSGAVEAGMGWMVGPRPKPSTQTKAPANPVALGGKDASAAIGDLVKASPGSLQNAPPEPYKSTTKADPMKGVTPALQAVVSRAAEISTVPFGMYPSGGSRTVAEQNALQRAGWSKTSDVGVHGKGLATDLIPIVNGQPDPNNKDGYAAINAAMTQASKELGVPLTWGGSWMSFPDAPHYQITPQAAASFKADPNATYKAPQAIPFSVAEAYELGNAGYPGIAPPSQGQLFASLEKQYNLPAGYLNGTYGIETNYGKNVATSSAGAKGPFQFIPSTAAKYGLANPNSLAASAEATAHYAADNAAGLKAALGRDPTAGELYLAHQQGVDGAVSLLTHPDQPAAQAVGSYQRIAQNLPASLRAGASTMTGGDFAKYWGGELIRRAGISPTDAGPAPLAYAEEARSQFGSLATQLGGRALSKGARDRGAVAQLQIVLNAAGATDRFGQPLTVDGVFGNRTKEAVNGFRTKNGLPATGIADAAVFNKLTPPATAPNRIGTEGSPELAGQVAPSQPSRPQFFGGPGIGSIAPNNSRDFAAGAATAAVAVDPAVQRAFVPSGKATLAAALEHPNEQFNLNTYMGWDPAAARIAGTLRQIAGDTAAQDAAFAAQKASAGKAGEFIKPIEADSVTIPKSFQDWIGGGPGAGPGQEHQFPPEQGLGADAQRAFDAAKRGYDIEHWLQEPTAQGSNMFDNPASVSDPFRPSGGSSGTYEPGNSGSSFDNFAAGMSSTYQTQAGGGSWSQTFFPSSSSTTYEPGGSNTPTYQDYGNSSGNDYGNVGGIP